MWGINKFGCLGLGHTKNQFFPLRVIVMCILYILKIEYKWTIYEKFIYDYCFLLTGFSRGSSEKSCLWDRSYSGPMQTFYLKKTTPYMYIILILYADIKC